MLSRVFFYHAEAGIRDRDVTRFQPCALPICLTPALSWEYLQQHVPRGTKIRTIVKDSFGGSTWFDSWIDMEKEGA